MTDPKELGNRSTLLQGKSVAFTGRLASMSRSEAVELVRSYGGHFARTIGRHTNLLVVGQEGWPLRRNGRLTRKLEKANQLQSDGSPIEIVSESAFFDQLGLNSSSGEVHRRYTTAQVARILQVPGERIRAWVFAGLLRPAASAHGLMFFDFCQVSRTKSLAELIQAGVPVARLKQSLAQLHHWLDDAAEPLDQLSLLERDGRIMVRMNEGLADVSGQLHFEFSEQEQSPNSIPAEPGLPDYYLETAYSCEDEGDWDGAIQAYRQALLLAGPTPDNCFELAGALYYAGARRQALERYWQAVELEPDFPEAWNNIGNLLAEFQEYEDAIQAYRKAIELSPAYADAHYNLADTLEEAGDLLAARSHWKAFLGQVASGPEADYARQRLALK